VIPPGAGLCGTRVGAAARPGVRGLATLLSAALLLDVLLGGSSGAQQSTDTGDRESSGHVQEHCELQPGPVHAVARVIDGETLALDDGTEVRLIGALAPRRSDVASEDASWPPEPEARAALERIVAGRSVALGFAGRRQDRYGRVLAHVFADHDGEKVWVQGRMLTEGHARAYTLAQSTACTAELLAHEAVARDAGRGLWSNPAYVPRSAAKPLDLLRARGTFQLVEGVAQRVKLVRGRVYIDFGAEWRRSFSATVTAATLRGRGLDPSVLEGRHLRVRGWIDRRSGPIIELSDAALIEILGPERNPAAVDAQEEKGAGGASDTEPAHPAQKERRPARGMPGAINL